MISLSFAILNGVNSGADIFEGNTTFLAKPLQTVWITNAAWQVRTACRNGIEPYPPRHTICREALDHTNERSLAAAIRESCSWISHETIDARCRDDLAFRVVSLLVPLVKKF